MTDHTVTFDTVPTPVRVPTGTLLVDAARLAGVEIGQPCGGQGRCGRCLVQIVEGSARRRSALRLTDEDIAAGYALACQTLVEGDVRIAVPQEEKLARRLTSDRTALEVSPPEEYDPAFHQTLQRKFVSLDPPTMEDQTDDWSRLQRMLRQAGFGRVRASLALLRRMGGVLRQSDWQVTAVVDVQEPAQEGALPDERLVELLPGRVFADEPLWGAAVDIGTTTVTLWLVDLTTGKVHAQAAEYNGQIARGEDVVSRIIYSGKNGGGEEIRQLVLGTINTLVGEACRRVNADLGCQPEQIYKAVIAGNSTMIHLLLGVPAASIRLSPFVTALNNPPLLTAGEVGIHIHPEASVDCLPGVASYVGADISAGVFSSGMDDTEKITLFLDVGTNGEMVLGSREWLVTCACSAGPAFEGAGVVHGMRAARGAIEEIWINSDNAEPTYRVIGGGQPKGICGSGLISLLAELFLAGVIDKGGNFDTHRATPRVRESAHGWEYVVAWGRGHSHACESSHGEDITFTRVDIDNLLRAKAAIFAGFNVLAESVGVPLELVEQLLIGGSFGKYINVEKAVQIGLLPDMPWERFQFLGNTAVRGAYHALLNKSARTRIEEIAARMTYIELSADNTFYDAFMSAMFLPHTDLARFPTVAAALQTR